MKECVEDQERGRGGEGSFVRSPLHPFLPLYFDTPEGGESAAFAPQLLLGSGPIVSSRSAPLVSSSWVNQGLLSGFPLRVARCMYLF